ncbi:HsdS specificity subunit type I R/M (plasmid) [Lactococcus cremoris subsp. cremoris UC509.9]|uniref:Specificity subunit Lla33I n=14 Tax=Lactococcus TaxID=1357 RepID=Q9REY0_9LACT|nr:restriction endonuclease subunit S [Lactococcus lactis]AAF17614.1 specificity subunit Lla33I [Lactococcus lactis]AFW92808.1 HsdS specificity subunit type I R/M [Lactococcus cremoris subsp. cremoris UC509.9]BAC11868.1 type I R/M system specificity subunit [Lactococcus lactis subsp. lactis bv. diacetylactis]
MVGTMAKIDDSVKKKVPELRFPGFTDDWEERKLGSLTTVVRGASPRPIQDPKWFDKESDIGWLRIADVTEQNGRIYHLEQHISKLGQEKTRVLTEPHLLLSIAATVGKPVVNYVKTGVHDGFLIFLNPTFEREFMFQWLEMFRPKWQKYGQPGSQVNLNSELVRNQEIVLPNYKEQQKIGSFFKQLDNTITLHQRKLDLLKEQKKGYLQKMFPKNGAKVPELRFAGFADDWEERKLSSMTNYKNGKSHEDKQSTSGKLELINLNSISISGGLKHSGKFIDEADDTLQKDDLVMILSDVGHGDLLGRVALIPEDDRFVLNQRVALLRPNTTADPQFLFSYINAHQYYFKAQGAGMSQLNISKGSVENFISFVPIIEEQKKIGSFFKQLDETIALHQRKLDLLKEQKKGFLQKMFV